jgi:hypothetical protein
MIVYLHNPKLMFHVKLDPKSGENLIAPNQDEWLT